MASPAFAQRLAVQATLLHKGDDVLIHAAPLNPGNLIILTVPSSGVMKPLLKVQPVPFVIDADGNPAPAGVPLRIARRQPRYDLIAGVAVDSERLYVVTATRVYAADPRVRTGGEPLVTGHHFRLHAFWLKDGSPIMGVGYQLPLVSDDPNAKEAPDTKQVTETLAAGPMELVKGGVRCRGTTVIFTEKSVKSVDVKGKQFTPPPDFFEPGLGLR